MTAIRQSANAIGRPRLSRTALSKQDLSALSLKHPATYVVVDRGHRNARGRRLSFSAGGIEERQVTGEHLDALAA